MARIVKDPEERRSELIACAQRLFQSKGYERTSVGDIVNEIGVAKGTFYYYFESKQAILEAITAGITAQGVAILQDIVTNESLSALEKWKQAFLVLGSWKFERKDEILTILRSMQQDENVLLRYRLRVQAVQLAAPQLVKIIQQGVEEGVFQTNFVKEDAEFAFSIMQTFSDSLSRILLYPDNPVLTARRLTAAAQSAVERVLGASPGSLPIIAPNTFDAWFEE